MARRHRAEESEGAPEWLLTYSDLVTLCLTFFVLLFSMATIDKQKFEQMANSLKSTFMRNSNGEMFKENKGKQVVSMLEQNNPEDSGDSQVNSKTKDEDRQLEQAKEQIQEAIKNLDIQDYVSIVEEKSSLILRLDSIILFNSGSADILPSGRDILNKLGSILKELDQSILVQGHADDRPINTLLFPSNWELSTKRATNVVVFLINNCGLKPQNLTATGNAEFKPIRPNDSEKNRQKNRRIDIVIEK